MIPIFVGGCPRSWTTYIRNVIASHPDVTGLTAHDFGLADGDTNTLEGWLFHRGLSNKQIWYRMSLAALRARTPYVVEKTPANALSFDKIRDVFPKAILVRVWREKEPTISSIMKASEWAPLPAERQRAEEMFRLYAEVNDGISVNYDEFMDDQSAAARLYAVLGLRPHIGVVSNPEGIPGSRG